MCNDYILEVTCLVFYFEILSVLFRYLDIRGLRIIPFNINSRTKVLWAAHVFVPSDEGLLFWRDQVHFLCDAVSVLLDIRPCGGEAAL